MLLKLGVKKNNNQQQLNGNPVDTVLKTFYMYYYLNSFDDPQTAIKTITDVAVLLKLGSLDLEKFGSDSRDILK